MIPHAGRNSAAHILLSWSEILKLGNRWFGWPKRERSRWFSRRETRSITTPSRSASIFHESCDCDGVLEYFSCQPLSPISIPNCYQLKRGLCRRLGRCVMFLMLAIILAVIWVVLWL